MEIAAPAVYVLCFLTSAACGTLLVRSYLQSRTRLLLWSAICFVLLAFNNLFVLTDIVLLPAVDLSPLRTVTTMAAAGTLLYAFVWELD
jgi:hypothetical protein